MPSWGEILKEIGEQKSPLDLVRRKYLKDLSDYTKRNTIIYYSGFLNEPGNVMANTDINDSDMEGFMSSIKGMDCKKGLDLILHTPGGYPQAAEAIIKYIKRKFGNNFRIIVPHMAMSAGTMMACAGFEIILSNHSFLGPIDPQFNGIPAYNIVEEFRQAKKELGENTKNTQYWAILLQKYPAAFLKSALDAIDLSKELLEDWLVSNMFKDEEESEREKIISKISSNLNEHSKSKIHGRHLDYDFCKSIGLKVKRLEDEGELQEKVLSLHHACVLTLEKGRVEKLIESQLGQAIMTVSVN